MKSDVPVMVPLSRALLSLFLLAVVAGIFSAISMIPEMRRYLRIREM